MCYSFVLDSQSSTRSSSYTEKEVKIGSTDQTLHRGDSQRVDIANIVALLFQSVELPPQSQLDIAMGWRDSELVGTGPALLVGKKNRLSFRQPRRSVGDGLSRPRFYKKKIPLARHRRLSPLGIALIFAVRRDSGIRSLEDIRKQKYPLRIFRRAGAANLATTIYAIEEVLKAYGMSYRDIEKWGGKIMEAPNPSGPSGATRFSPAKPMRSSTKA
jgi:hypothetical protein